MHRRLALTVFTLLVAGCSSGGGSGSGSVPAVPNNAAPQSAGTANAQVLIVIPAPTTAQSMRRSQYISPSTQSMSFAAANGTPAVVALTSTSPGCTTGNSGLQCTVNVPLPIGANQQFVVATYANSSGTGSPLSTNKITASIVAGQANPITVSLGGVPASVVFATATSPVPAVAATSIPVTVNVKDAAGNTIVGSSPFSDANGNPVTIALADADTTGATTLSPASLTAPGSATLTYDNYFQPVAVTLSASASTMSTSTTPIPFAGKPVVIGFVGNGTPSLTANSGIESIGTSRHAATSARRSPLTLSYNTMTGLLPTGSTSLPYSLSTHTNNSTSYEAWYNDDYGMATAPNGHVYFSEYSNSQFGLFDAGTTPAIPAASSIIAASASQVFGPLALGPGGKMYAAYVSTSGPPTAGYEQINPATGAVIGSPVVFSSQFTANLPNAIAVGPDGTVYVEAFPNPNVGDEVLAYSSAGALKTVFWTGNSHETNDAIYGLYCDANNKVYISADYYGTIDVVPSTASGLTLPAKVITNNNNIDDGVNVLVDRVGNVLWATYTTVSVYAPGAGSAPPGGTNPATPWYPSTDTAALQTFHGSTVTPVYLSFGPGS